MARRNDHSRDELQEMALAAAERLVADSGFAQLSARKVAAEIGYTVGTLYHIFQNLDDLVLQVNARTLDAMVSEMDNALRECDNGPDGVKRLAQAYYGFAVNHPNLWTMLFEHRLPAGQDLPEWYSHRVRRGFELVEKALLSPASMRSTESIHQASRVIWGGVHGICILAFSGKLDATDTGDIDAMLEMLVENFLAGFTRHIG